MTLLAALPASPHLLVRLANPALRALTLSIFVAIALSAFRVKTISVRLFAWKAVLYAALAMPLMAWVFPPLTIPAPAFLQTKFLQNVVGAASKLRGTYLTNRNAGQPLPATNPPGHLLFVGSEKSRLDPIYPESTVRNRTHVISPSHPTSRSILSSIQWNALAAGIYLAVASILLLRFFVGVTFSHRLLQRAQRIDEPRLMLQLVSHARATGLPAVPRIAASDFLSVPITMGVLHSTILLPASWREWDVPKLDAVLAHELSHVARRDALTQRLSLLHRAVFWFSPLAWWLDRHLADLAEQASDEAALSSGADRKDYARTLLGFFEALQATRGRIWWQAVSMAKAGQAEQRVERILSWKGSVAMRLQKSVALVVIACASPVVYLAASAQAVPGVSLLNVQSAQEPPSSPPPAATGSSQATAPPPSGPDESGPDEPGPAKPGPAESGPASGVPAGTVVGVPTPPIAPAPAAGVVGPVNPPLAPIPPIAPVAAWDGQSEDSQSSSDHGFTYHYGDDDEERFVIVSGKTDSLTMSGSRQDARHVEKLRKNIPGDFIWFQRDEKSYVIRDQATVDRAKKLWEPQAELGKKQAALGQQQEALGKRQEELSERMEKIRVNVPDMTGQLEKLQAELKQLSSGATSEQVGQIQSEIGELQAQIGEVQAHAGDQQGKLGEEMGALGEKQGKLGEQQGELGRQQGKLAEQATREMKQILDEAITKGTAQPEL